MPKISTHKDMVENILTRSKRARNDNVTLYYHILNEFYNVDLGTLSAHDLLVGMKAKNYPNYDNVARASRKLQEVNENLRGTEWEKRHGLQRETIEDLNTNFK